VGDIHAVEDMKACFKACCCWYNVIYGRTCRISNCTRSNAFTLPYPMMPTTNFCSSLKGRTKVEGGTEDLLGELEKSNYIKVRHVEDATTMILVPKKPSKSTVERKSKTCK